MPTARRDLADALVEVVCERMHARGLPVQRAAAQIGVVQSTLHRRLHGRGDLTIDEWAALAATVGTDLRELITAAGTRSPVRVGA